MTPVPGRVDPEVAAAIAALPFELGTFTSADELVAQRGSRVALYDRLAAPRGVDHDLDGITVRLFHPDGPQRPRPGLLWIHGGGYMGGSRLIDDHLLDRWCQRFDCVTASVEYRLAPEHPYPAALDDCYRALSWMLSNARQIGLGPERLGIGGISAGGGLAAALALLARDRGAVRPAFQVLVSPMLDDRPTASSQWDDAMVWPPTANRIGWEAYHREIDGVPPPYAAAARATDLAGLPPSLVVVGGVEVFHDESVDFARRLVHAGVSADLHVHGGAPHGFETMAPASALTRRAFRAIEDWLDPWLSPSQAGPDIPERGLVS